MMNHPIKSFYLTKYPDPERGCSSGLFFQRNSGKFSMLLLVLLAICMLGQSSQAQTSIYVFDPNQSTVVQTGGFAGVHETYPIEGIFQLSVDFDAGTASFEQVDANLLEPSSFLYTQDLGVLFNMTELAGNIVDDTTIEFNGRIADDIDTDIRLVLTFEDNSVRLVGEAVPACFDCFYYDLDAVAHRKYAGGRGELNDPYKIATAEDLMLLGETPEDYDKHFILTADIDLDPNLPGRKVFDKAVIAQISSSYSYRDLDFTGYFNGNGHIISNLVIDANDIDYAGLFGGIGYDGTIENLKIVDAKVNGNKIIGALTGLNKGTIISCHSMATVTGISKIGGLVGQNTGSINICYSSGSVTGKYDVGGLIGGNSHYGIIENSHCSAIVSGIKTVGGLVGQNLGALQSSYSESKVSGESEIGGLTGYSYYHSIDSCNSSGEVMGNESVGGLVGYNNGIEINSCSSSATVTAIKKIGGLIGYNTGHVKFSYSTGQVNGQGTTGGLVGMNSSLIHSCYSTSNVSGTDCIGGLIGSNGGAIFACYASGEVISNGGLTGGLMGENYGFINSCYSTSDVLFDNTYNPNSTSGRGGLVGLNEGEIVFSYATGLVQGNHFTGGLNGWLRDGMVFSSYWDRSTSNQTGSAGGIAKTTIQLKKRETFRGWGYNGVWTIDEGNDYPRLVWEDLAGSPIIDEHRSYGGGKGDVNDPYQIKTREQFAAIGWYIADYDKHFILKDDLDFVGIEPNDLLPIGCTAFPFTGTFNGNGHTIHNLRYVSPNNNYVGAFGYICPVDVNTPGGSVQQLHLADVEVTGKSYVGGMIGTNLGTVIGCSVSGNIQGSKSVGGLVGINDGYIFSSKANTVSTSQGFDQFTIGGFVGCNTGIIESCCSAGFVSGASPVGGFVGLNNNNHQHSGEQGFIFCCYSLADVEGYSKIGGFVGWNIGTIAFSYSAGQVAEGREDSGGFAGECITDVIFSSFWDVDFSGLTTSAGGIGKTTAEMQMESTFTDAGWDFVDETTNGTEDIWWILEGQDYPKLWWELIENSVNEPNDN